MEYFESKQRPRILLINFSQNEAKRFSESGYIVDCGYIGGTTYIKEKQLVFAKYCRLPKPLYEYDIFITKTDMPDEGKKYVADDQSEIDITDELVALSHQVLSREGLVITFLGESSIDIALYEAGLNFLYVMDADPRDSSLNYVNYGSEIPELDTLFYESRKSVAKVHKYIIEPQNLYSKFGGNSKKFYMNDNRDIVGEYGTRYESKERPTNLKYILLPEFKDDVKVALSILEIAKQLAPEMFTSANVQQWLESDDFILDEVKQISQEIEGEKVKLKEFLAKKEEEIEETNNKWSFLKKILFTDDENFEGDDRLSINVKKTLEYLGFVVTLSDEQNIHGKKKEDLIITDSEDNYKSLCEVKGTIKSNPPEAYIGQLSNHMRKNTDKSIKGLLVVNYDYNMHPFNRTRIYNDYENEQEDGLLSADDIGVISTVDLFKIALAVKNGEIPKEDARRLIKTPYRIEYNLDINASKLKSS